MAPRWIERDGSIHRVFVWWVDSRFLDKGSLQHEPIPSGMLASRSIH
jgi:hypothetical protein